MFSSLARVSSFASSWLPCLLSPYPCEHSYPKLLSLSNYFYDQQLYRKHVYATPTAKAKSVSTDLLDLFQYFNKTSVKALACSSAASVKDFHREKLYSRTGNAYLWNSIVFQLRIILAEQRYKYIFFCPTSLAFFSLSAGKRLVTGFPSMVVVLDTSLTFPSEDFSSRESLLWRSSEWDLFSITVCLLFDLTWVFYLSCCYRGSTSHRS